MTDNDLTVAVTALRAALQSSAPDSEFQVWAKTVIEAWDSVGQADNPDAQDLKYANCMMALYQAITASGYNIDQDQCAIAAQKAIDAVIAYRTKSTQTQETTK